MKNLETQLRRQDCHNQENQNHTLPLIIYKCIYANIIFNIIATIFIPDQEENAVEEKRERFGKTGDDFP